MKIYKRTERVVLYGHYSDDHTVEMIEGFYLKLEDAKGNEKWKETTDIEKLTKRLIFKTEDIYEDEGKYSREYIYEIEVQE